VKPFLLLATRPEDAAADNEYELFLRFAGRLLRVVGGKLLRELVPAFFPLGLVAVAGAHEGHGDGQGGQPQPAGGRSQRLHRVVGAFGHLRVVQLGLGAKGSQVARERVKPIRCDRRFAAGMVAWRHSKA